MTPLIGSRKETGWSPLTWPMVFGGTNRWDTQEVRVAMAGVECEGTLISGPNLSRVANFPLWRWRIDCGEASPSPSLCKTRAIIKTDFSRAMSIEINDLVLRRGAAAVIAM